MSYGFFKENYFKVNGYDEKYQKRGNEDDDFGNRLTVLGLEGKVLNMENPLLHLWHYFDPTKKQCGNDEYYYKVKKLYLKKKYRCEYGIKNQLENDEIIVNKLN